jgi:hypothetical protein
MNDPETAPRSEKDERSFVEGVDYYFEAGLMVLTELFLKKRGYCCGNGCRHCPYSKDEREAALKKKVV